MGDRWRHDPRLLAAAALALILGATVGFALEDDRAQGLAGDHALDQAPCGLPSLGGHRLSTTVEDSGVRRDHQAWERTVRVTGAAADLAGGQLGVCTVVGDVDIEATGSQTVELVFHVRATGDGARQAVEDQALAWDLRQDGGALGVVAWQVPGDGRDGSGRASVDIDLRVPVAGPYRLLAQTSVGAIDLEGLDLGTTRLATSTGDVEAEATELTGDLAATASVGDIDLSLAPAGSATIELESDTGDIMLHLTDEPDTGYDVTGSAGVGDVEIAIGPTESHDRHEPEHGPGETEHARSQGYSQAARKVTVEARAGVGDVDVHTDG